jgi:dihydroorotase
MVMFDPAARWRVEPARFLSKSRNTPFGGRELVGRVVRTLVGGRTVFEATPTA